jgi:hypothetical protein
MIIKKLTEQSCKSLLQVVKHDFDNIKSSYYSHPINDFDPLTSQLSNIEGGGFNLPDSLFDSENQLKLEMSNGPADDFTNSKIIFEAFGDLTPLEANDSRLWVRLTHDHCHKYVVKRWSDGEKTSAVLIERFFYEGLSLRARLHNGVSRLWWIAHLTVDKNAVDDELKWRFTKAVCEKQDFITSIFERHMGTYENVRFGILEYYIENPDAFIGATAKKIKALTRDINNYGSVTLLPLMSKEEVKEVCAMLLPTEIVEDNTDLIEETE